MRTCHDRSMPPTPCGSGPSSSIVRTAVILTSVRHGGDERDVDGTTGLGRLPGGLGHLDRGAPVLAGDLRSRAGLQRGDEVDDLAGGVADPPRVPWLEVGERP